MRILLINHRLLSESQGGAERSVQLLQEGLRALGHEVLLLCIGPDTVHSRECLVLRERWLPKRRLIWARRPLLHFLNTFTLAYDGEVLRVLRHWRPDVVHTNNIGRFSVRIWELVARERIPLVHTPRDYFLLSPTESRTLDGCTITDALFSMPKLFFSRYVDGVIGISSFILKEHMRAGFFENSIASAVIGNPVQQVTSVVSTRRSIPTIGYIGALSERKGVEDVLLACQELSKRFAFELLIAGSGDEEYLNRLRSMAHPLNCHFLGFCSSSDFFSRIDWLVVPSRWHEPFGRVVIEANAAGVPVLVSGAGGLPELVTNGQNGYVYGPNGSFKCLIDGLSYILNMDPVAYRHQCLAKATEFSMVEIAQRHVNFYQAVGRGRSQQGVV